jgi:hypothetical protein
MSNLGIDWMKVRRERARLIILRALGEQPNGTLDSSMIEEILALFTIREERVWIHEQLDYLERREAVRMVSAGSVRIATLTKVGRRHIDRDIAIEGVTRPSEPEN